MDIHHPSAPYLCPPPFFLLNLSSDSNISLQFSIFGIVKQSLMPNCLIFQHFPKIMPAYVALFFAESNVWYLYLFCIYVHLLVCSYVCRNCGKCSNIFSTNGGKVLSQIRNVPLLATFPIDPKINTNKNVKSAVKEFPNSKMAIELKKLITEVLSRKSCP